MPKAVEAGFAKADGGNLPQVDDDTLAVFLNSTVLDPEMRSVKTQRSARTAYGDQAVGYVQVSRTDHVCTVKGEITPEHCVRKKGYSVLCEVNEKEATITKATCNDCPASAGCCKHAVAFVNWLHRRSEEQSCTSVPCYWLKSKLSQVGTSNKTLLVADMLSGGTENESETNDEETVDQGPDFFFNAVSSLYASSPGSSLLSKNLSSNPSLSILTLLHKETAGPHTGEAFMKFCSDRMSEAECIIMAEQTRNQSTSKLWFSLRHGRITASKLWDVSRCQTVDGSLVNSILGAKKVKDTKAMKRGRVLEPEVLQVVSKTLSKKLHRTGLVLNKDFPVFGASPDALFQDEVIEVKCPTTSESYLAYFTQDQKAPSRKYEAQIQLQMFMCNKRKGLYCVASPDFEISKNVTIIEVSFNENFFRSLVKSATSFWISCIYPKLCYSLRL